jgi:hypothetical protein
LVRLSSRFARLFSCEVAECGTFGDEFDGCAGGVSFGGWGEPVPGASVVEGFSGDIPAAVVEQEMVVSTEEDSVPDVGPSVVFGPQHNVVGFAPGRRPVTARGCASAPDDREGFALFGGEEPVLAPVVEGPPVFVEHDPRDPGLARERVKFSV